MSYVIEIYNTANNSTWTKVAQLHDSECTCRIHRKMNEDWSIEISYIVPLSWQGTDKSSYLLSWNAKARVLNLDDSTDYQTFFLRQPIISKSTSGQTTVTVTGLHVALVTMQNVVIDTQYDFQNMDVLQIMFVLEVAHPIGAWLYGGSVASTTKLSLLIGWESWASAFQKIVTACRGEVDFSESDNTIYIYDYGTMGSATKYINIRAERNLKSISMQKYNRNVVTKMYGIGGYSPVCTIAGARHVIYSIDGQNVTIDHNKLVPENGSWNSNFALFKTGALAGTAFGILDSSHGAIRDVLTLTGKTTSLVAGDKLVIQDISNIDVNYIRAGTAIASYGTIEDVYQNTEHGNAVNLVETPFLDGTYTGGLCANWTKNGTPTCTENTNTTYIQYGSKSQKIVGGADADGLYQNISGLEIGKYYRIKANVYLEGSTPVSKINLYIGSTAAVPVADDIESDAAGTGKWVSFEWWGEATATTTRLTVLQSGSQSATFYVDAVQIAECPEDISQNYTANCESLDLWKETFDKLIANKDPLIEYKCNFVDLNKMNKLDYPYEEINLGDTVTITDADIGINAVSARVKEINYDPFHPELTEHIVSNI
jgi:hypothetical protein